MVCVFCGEDAFRENPDIHEDCLKDLIGERDEARRVARALWWTDPDEGTPLSIQEAICADGLSWLTEEGPEEISARKALQAADHCTRS